MSVISDLFPTQTQVRNLALLGGLLLAQVVLALVLLVPRGGADFAPERLIPAMQDVGVAELLIEDMAGERIRLVHAGEEEWNLPEAEGYPALEILADQLVEDMVELDNARPATETEASHDRLRVGDDNFERRVTATLEDGAEVVLFVGTSPLPRATHVRVDGQENVYISDDLRHREVATEVTRWVDTVYYSVNQSKVRKFTLTNDNGVFVFERDENDEWQMPGLEEGEVFNPNNLISLVTTVSTISLTNPLGNTEKPEYGFLAPQATVNLEVENDEETNPVTILIGADSETSNRVVIKTSESPWYVEANRFTVDRLIERTRDEFLVQEEPEELAPPVPPVVPAAN